MTSQESVSIANVIRDQIGHKALFMLGAKQLIAHGDGGLSFRIGRNEKGVNCVWVALNPQDLYDIKFLKIRGGLIDTVSESLGVYAENLLLVIESQTGMSTSL